MKRNFNLFMILLLLLLSACGNNSNHVHEWNESGIISRPTCTESGLARFVCNLCEETKVDINLEALGHNEVVDNAIEATCTKTGLTEGSHCDICSEVLVRQEVIPVLEHEWNEGIVTFEPVKGVEGEKTFTCKICGEHKYEVIPAIEVADGEIYEVDGIKYVNYGSYPQTHVVDEALLLELNKLTAINDRGYYEYNGKEYAKVTAMPFRTGSYNDSYGNTIYYEYSDGSRIQKKYNRMV